MAQSPRIKDLEVLLRYMDWDVLEINADFQEGFKKSEIVNSLFLDVFV